MQTELTLLNIRVSVWQLFGRMGRLEKILIFFVSGTEAKALVQFSSVDEASHALRLDGDPMYPGSTLRVMFAKRTSLEVSANGPRSRDFTNPHLPVHERSERTPSHGRGGPVPADYYQAPPAMDRHPDYEYSRADAYRRSVDRSMDRELYHRGTYTTRPLHGTPHGLAFNQESAHTCLSQSPSRAH